MINAILAILAILGRINHYLTAKLEAKRVEEQARVEEDMRRDKAKRLREEVLNLAEKRLANCDRDNVKDTLGTRFYFRRCDDGKLVAMGYDETNGSAELHFVGSSLAFRGDDAHVLLRQGRLTSVTGSLYAA